ncbi:MAG: hypothetical protein Q9204_003546 [Flavoplaca sp. TL-2023a]
MAQSQISAKKQQELQQQYTNYKNNLQQLADRIGNVEQETEEHNFPYNLVAVRPLRPTEYWLTAVQNSRLVLDTLTPLPGERKCFRMINGVLVERTVKDVLPALQINSDGLKRVLDELVKQYKRQQEDMEKWKVRCCLALAMNFTMAESDDDEDLVGHLLTFSCAQKKNNVQVVQQ